MKKKVSMFKTKREYLVYVFMIICIFMFFYGNRFILIENQSEQVIYYERVDSSDCFSLSSIHSVSRTSIVEKYEITGRFLINNVATIYYDQGGAGLPDELRNGEILTLTDDGAFLVTREYNLLEEILLISDKKSNNEFICKDKIIKLSNIDKEWEIYNMSVVKHNVFESVYYWIRMWLYEI